jgi:hypothetical protein
VSYCVKDNIDIEIIMKKFNELFYSYDMDVTRVRRTVSPPVLKKRAGFHNVETGSIFLVISGFSTRPTLNKADPFIKSIIYLI